MGTYSSATFLVPPTVQEPLFPAGIVVETTLRAWAMSRWRGGLELTREFLRLGYAHLPADAPRMFRLQEVKDDGGTIVGLIVHFRNPFDAFRLLGQVYWCGCEFIAFTTYNVYTDFYSTFPAPNRMHTLPYNTNEEE